LGSQELSDLLRLQQLLGLGLLWSRHMQGIHALPCTLAVPCDNELLGRRLLMLLLLVVVVRVRLQLCAVHWLGALGDCGTADR
jgi:hypothetical protein